MSCYVIIFAWKNKYGKKHGGCWLIMALFGKKKKDDGKAAESAENKQSNSVTSEMKVILEAREEEQQEKQAKALERLQEQEEADREQSKISDQTRQAAERILSKEFAPEGMTFFMVCDEVPVSAVPETEGNLIVRGDLRGTLRSGSDICLYQGRGEKYNVKVVRIKDESREAVSEASYSRVELEITRGDIPAPSNPDEQASRLVNRFAVLTDAKGIEDTKDPACKGMAAAGNPRTLVMLCEYGRFGKDPEYFSLTMDSLMTSEFITPAKVTATKSGKSNVSFSGIMTKKEPDVALLPVFTDNRLAKRAQQKGFGGPGLNQRFALSFAQTAAVARDDHHKGFLVNPGGPVTITIPAKLIDDMVKTTLFRERFGQGAADNASLALGGSGNAKLDNFIANGGPDIPGVQKIVIANPTNTPEFLAIEKAVRSYCGSHANISKLMILIAAPAANRNDMTYFCIVDCPEASFETECKGLAASMKPFMKKIKKIRFQLLSKMDERESLEKRSQWLYSKLPL